MPGRSASPGSISTCAYERRRATIRPEVRHRLVRQPQPCSLVEESLRAGSPETAADGWVTMRWSSTLANEPAEIRDWVRTALDDDESVLVFEFERWSGYGPGVDSSVADETRPLTHLRRPASSFWLDQSDGRFSGFSLNAALSSEMRSRISWAVAASSKSRAGLALNASRHLD